VTGLDRSGRSDRSDQAVLDQTLNSERLGTELGPKPCGEPNPLRAAEPGASNDPWAVTLSGGGFRATFAGLGVLRLLASIGALRDLRYVSSVSGGSVANGLLAISWGELRTAGHTAEAFDALVLDPAIDRISSKSLKWRLTRNLWRAVGSTTRTDLLARAFDDWFFGGTELTQLDPQVRWIFNAASLTSGVRFRFERDIVGDYTIGTASTAGTKLKVSTAAAASAAVPGALAPVRINGVRFPCGDYPPQLMDGGAYDNTGLEAIDRDDVPFFLASLNAGGLLRPGAYGKVPLVRDLARANSLLYRQSTALRTRAMVQQFERARRTPAGQPLPPGARHGLLVALATDFPTTDPGRLGFDFARLTQWRAAHPERRTWEGKDLAEVPTVFDRLDADLCRALIYRGWWLVGAALAAYAGHRLPADLTTLPHP
jgi:NTE family protein